MSKPYATLTVPEKWQWHADFYAFRRIVLGVAREDRTSPCDPDGIWFNAGLVDEAERRMRAKRDQDRERRDRQRGDAVAREGRALVEQWVKRAGYLDVETYMACERIDYSEVCMRIIRGNLAANRMPNEQNDRPSAAAALGVARREFQPTAEQLRAGRVALGLEPAEPAASAA